MEKIREVELLSAIADDPSPLVALAVMVNVAENILCKHIQKA